MNHSIIADRIVLLILLLTIVSLPALSQESPRPGNPDRGSGTLGSYSISDIERINITNGNVNLSIPLAGLPPIAGGKLSFNLKAIYNSKLWNTIVNEGYTDTSPPQLFAMTTLALSDLGGWKLGRRYNLTCEDRRSDYNWAFPQVGDEPSYTYLLNNPIWIKCNFIEPDGTQHELRPLDYQPFSVGTRAYLLGYYKESPFTTGTAMRYYSFDGSYIWAKVYPPGSAEYWLVVLRDGTQIIQYSNGIQRIVDTSGNSIKIYTEVETQTHVTTDHYQDERTGREIKYTFDPAGNGGGGQGNVSYQTVGGGWNTIQLNFGTTLVQGKVYQVEDPCLHDRLIVWTDVTVIRSIVFPQTQPGLPGRQFTFTYNSDQTHTATYPSYHPTCSPQFQTYNVTASNGWGELSQMVTPQGATVKYTYNHETIDFLSLSTLNNIPGGYLTKKEVVHDGTTDTWTYSSGIFGGSVVNPDGSSVTEEFYPKDPADGLSTASLFGFGGLTYRTRQSNKIMIERRWRLLRFDGGNNQSQGGVIGYNPVVDTEFTSLLNDSGNPVKMSAKKYQYDFNGNVTQETDYDWFDPSLVGRDPNNQNLPTGVPGGATILRTTTASYHNQAPSSSSTNVYAKRALANATPLILNAAQESITGPSITRFSYDNQGYGTAPTVGNLTQTSRWNNTNNTWLNTSSSYDSYGNVATITDPNNNVKSLVYDSQTHAQPTQVTVDPLNGTGAQTTTAVYDYYTGLVTSSTDPNNVSSRFEYNDPLNRITKTIRAANTSAQSQSTVQYFDSDHKVITTADKDLFGDNKLKSETVYDSLGRTIESRQYESTSAYISVQTIYDSLDRVSQVSNPYRPGESVLWTTTEYDPLGRILKVTTPDGAHIDTGYTGNQVTVTDQAGKQRRSESDALGRLVRVYEDPNDVNYQTNYLYDALGNLHQVNQSGQTRWFAYDSLSRLIRAKNPEQEVNSSLPPYTDPLTGNNGWSIAYTYDANGNLLSKTDARNITVSYQYDALNRNTTVDYSNTSINPDITRGYDSATNGKGRFLYFCKGDDCHEHRAVDRYDALGRPLNVRQHYRISGVWSSGYQTQQTYDLAGNVKSQTYPSGHTVNYSYDNAGRLSSFTGNLGDGVGRAYADQINYSAAGQTIRERFGTQTPLFLKHLFNKRQQMVDMRLSTINDQDNWNRGAYIFYYGVNAAANSNPIYDDITNNGNLMRVITYVPTSVDGNGTITANIVPQLTDYTYDSLNRVKGMNESQQNSSGNWNFGEATQTYSYDPFGNRQITSATGGMNGYNPSYNTGTNRINGLGYDTAGNITSDPVTGGTMTYDAENHLLTSSNGGGGSYVYDADGKRVRRILAGGQTIGYAYGIDGELVAEYLENGTASMILKKEYGYRNGQLLVTAEGGSTTNFAQGKSATQSSTGFGGAASRAVDGNTSGNYADGSVTHTEAENNPWWQVDLGSIQQIGEIRIWNRTDCCSERLHDFYVFVSDSPFNSGDLTATINQAGVSSYYNTGSVAAGTDISVGRSGRYVRVQLPGFNYLHLAEVEVRGGAGVQWLVQDHLGSTRMVVDQTGSLQGVKRYDYAPFGEEMTAGIRTGGYGYIGSNVRQKFDGYERDNESGLDFAQARYFGSILGRFTSVDPENEGAIPDDPQSWNGYAFAANNPLANTDPDGRGTCYYTDDKKGTLLGCEGQSNIKVTTTKGDQGTLTVKSGKNKGEYDLGKVYAETAVGPSRPDVADFVFEMGRRAPAIEKGVKTAGLVAAGIVAAPYIGLANAAMGTADLITKGGRPDLGTLAVIIPPAKLTHIFGKAAHNLGPLVASYGSEVAAYEALEKATIQTVTSQGISGIFEVVVNVGGLNVTVRGAVVNGLVKIGTAFR